jgi:hypothetical protein
MTKNLGFFLGEFSGSDLLEIGRESVALTNLIRKQEVLTKPDFYDIEAWQPTSFLHPIF